MHPSLNRPIQLRLLGEFDVAVHDISHTRAIGYAKPRLLLAILAVAQGKPIARTELAQMLWPASQQDSRANLRHALFVLRRLFASVPDAWISGRHTLALNPDTIMVDALALTGGYPDLGHAERLAYDRGELLEYLEHAHSAAFTAWHSTWQLRIERDIAECREGLVTELTAQGKHADAIEYAKKWVLHRPGDELAHRHLIRLLRDSGNDEASALALDHCHQMLREHRNTEPSAPTLALLDGAFAAAPANTLEAAATPAPYMAMPARQYRPLAVLGIALTMDTPDAELDDPLQGLRLAVERIRTKAETMGGHVKPGVDGSLLILFGFPVVTEKPAHLCACLACELRDLPLPKGIRVGLGMHADVVMMHNADPAQLVPALSHHAMKLAYLAEAGEILLTTAARDRIITQFTVHYETRHGHAQHVLDAARDMRPVGRMFGRMREFDTLVRMWARLPRAQAPSCMMVRGWPGIGKSLLVNVMAEYVRRTGGDVRVLTCEEGHEHKPLHPVLNHFPTRPFQEDTRENTMTELASALLQRSSPDAGLLIIWEDLHWADPSSIALIEALLKRPQTAPTLVLLSAREEFEFDDSTNELRLRPLDRRAMAELVMHRSRGQRLTATQRDRIVQQAGGIPLFAEEIVRQVALGAEIGATPLILDLIAARMSALDATAQQLAQFAAVADGFDDTMLARAAQHLGLTTRQALVLLGQLRQHGLLEEGMPVRFCHALTRLAVYETIDPLDRKQLHAKVAQLLIDREPGMARAQAAVIAQHLDAAGHADACRWWCTAGRDALAQSATSEARAMSDRALAALQRVRDEREHRKAELECQLLRGAVLTLLEGGGAVETSEAYERVAQLHRHDDDADMHFQMQWGEWVVTFNTQPHSRALRVAENLLLHAEQHDSDIVLGSAQYAIGQTRLFMGDVARAERWLRTALHTLGKRSHAGHELPVWGLERADSARGMLAWVLALQGRDDEGIEVAREGLGDADDPGQLPSRVLCQAVLCELHRLRSDIDETLAAAAALKDITDHSDLVFWRALSDSMTGWVATSRGDHRGVQAIEHAIRVAGRAMPIWQAPLELLMADSHSLLSQPEPALKCVERAGALIEHYGTQLIRGAYLYQKGLAQAADGGTDLAAASWQQAIVESRRLGLSLYARRAEARLNADAHSA